MTGIFRWIIGLAAAGGYMAAEANDITWLGLATKPFPILMLLWFLASRKRGLLSLFIGLGLVASLAGDMLLEAPVDLFLFGVGAFAIAHCFYIVAFTWDRWAIKPLRAIPFYVYGVGMIGFLGPYLGFMLVPVAIYAMLISTMLWRASARVRVIPKWTLWAGFLGAVLFTASDSLIAVDRFYAQIPNVRYPIIALYWLGQLGIVWSVPARRRKADRDG